MLKNPVCQCQAYRQEILFTALQKNITSDFKVAQFAALVAEFTDYHHGEQSLVEAVVKMAQTYVGSNNKNLLLPKVNSVRG